MEDLNSNYWDQLYRTHETRWDVGSPSTPLKTYIDQITDKSLKILIPGCGNAYEAEYLVDNGFTGLTVVDISPLLTSSLAHKFKGKKIQIITSNFFDVEGKYDLILEQTFFCALDPSLRPTYVKKVYDLLTPKGKLAGVLFDREFEGGPPFGGNSAEYKELFSKFFAELRIEPCYNSIPPRAGTEVFILAQRLS
jgi:SAM-dependent methyltransferase